MGQASSTRASKTGKSELGSRNEKYLQNFKAENKIIPEEKQNLIEFYLSKGNVQKAASVIKDALKDIENAPLSIAVTGESGAGKSTLINALRGVGNEEEGAANTGYTETTASVTEYKHPQLPRVSVWDLPGVGTPSFPFETYLQTVDFAKYDFFLIISATRFKDNDAKLAKAIAKMDKKFYFVRTKIDNDLSNEEKTKPKTFNKEKVLQKMRDDCVTQLRLPSTSSDQVFLVSSLERSDYDFPRLESTLLRDLPAHKRHIFMLSLPNITEATIDQKRDSLKQKVWLEALKAGAWASVPFGGLFSDSDIEKLRPTLDLYRSYFGLDDASLEKMATDLQVSVEDLKANLQFPQLLSPERYESLGEKWKKCFEKILLDSGGLIAAGLYFTKIFFLENLFLETVASDAKSLLKKGDLFGDPETQRRAKADRQSGQPGSA